MEEIMRRQQPKKIDHTTLQCLVKGCKQSRSRESWYYCDGHITGAFSLSHSLAMALGGISLHPNHDHSKGDVPVPKKRRKTRKAGAKVKPGQTCSVEGCTSRTQTRGFCSKHYQRWWKYGDPLMLQGGKVNR
ncbi:MAG: hypothetical protein ABIG66_01000 [Candidatus Kerfeldbacteria bacterium]